jgi:hypothetical protein
VKLSHISDSEANTDLQLWVEKGDKPVPRKSVMTFKLEPRLPRHEMFMDWKAVDDIDASVFKFVPPDCAGQIAFIDTP